MRGGSFRMIHLGDIKKINGAEIPIVDVITGGSPCQNLSIAGNREGLAGSESGLFIEQVRVVKEMREHDRSSGRSGKFIRPRFMVWENVPGAFSSGKPKGADFQVVLTEIVRIAEPEAPVVPLPDRGGWSKSGCIYSEVGKWSVAWRVHDAQFWGVPQRRKRIALVADFAGLAAPEVLFERKGLSWDSEESR
ncbi:MAG: DNA cytosine methyltransferase [Oscillospiraceae bacterium]|nr:DNA cytosine methyltransferase [Oscillospiraceae bacterium]